MRIDNPFHEGELQVQERANEFEEGARNGRVVADSIMKGALKFVAQQPMVILGSVDDEQNVWASVLFGPPGFVAAPDERRVEFNLARAGINEHDPFWKNIQHNPRIGALFLELTTRRRSDRRNATLLEPPDRALARIGNPCRAAVGVPRLLAAQPTATAGLLVLALRSDEPMPVPGQEREE